MRSPIVVCVLLLSCWLQAQEMPTDFLSAEFHQERRDKVKEQMPPNSVAVIFANPVRNRANDVDYIYHQDPDFYYLTGYREPHAVLVLFSEKQQKGDTSYDEMIFVQKRNPQAEQWNGRRLGVEGVKEQLGFEQVFNGEDFANADIDFDTFDQILFFDFKNDYRDGSSKADLFDLISQFKGKVDFPADFDSTKQRMYTMIKATEIENSANVAQVMGRYLSRNQELQQDPLLQGYVSAKDDAARKEIQEQVALKLNTGSGRLNAAALTEIMAKLREVKTDSELQLLTKAIEISAVGQQEVMKAMHPNMSEAEIQGIHEFVYKKYGSEYEGYPSIVGAGNNGCILHYIENNKPKVGENELVLMDLGAEYRGYTADVTRTIPASGTFTEAQKEIYNIVYDAQEAGIAACTAGAPFGAPNQAARAVINAGLIRLGIAKNDQDARQYFPHGTSHYLGLDVHDRGTYGPLQPNTVLTVEPGIYIPEGSPCDEKWWGIAIRIEDDILVTEKGPVNLSARAPRTVAAIEALMQEPSPLDNFVLPTLEHNHSH